ncbi:MAG: TatD family hydrolase [Treponema sp.]|jgi:TatD DNase family protein|nr:TatD family hydrolase [Treponema sp.]
MLIDAHCHPFDFFSITKEKLEAPPNKEVLFASSAWNLEQFLFNKENGVDAVHAFAVHPQLPTVNPSLVRDSLETLYGLASSKKKLQAVGETGFDLFNEKLRSTEKLQTELFIAHVELAIAKSLPLILHVRKAMHKIFVYSKILKKTPAVVFHSYSGTAADGESLCRRGVNAYFSFGSSILLNHKTAVQACALLPLEHLLTETDAPYQPFRRDFSDWKDLSMILQKVLRLRGEKIDISGLEERISENFRNVYVKFT